MALIDETTADDRSAVDPSRLHPGEAVEAHRDSVVLHRGTVEETMPQLGVVWIREAGTGARKMLSRDDAILRRC